MVSMLPRVPPKWPKEGPTPAQEGPKTASVAIWAQAALARVLLRHRASRAGRLLPPCPVERRADPQEIWVCSVPTMMSRLAFAGFALLFAGHGCAAAGERTAAEAVQRRTLGDTAAVATDGADECEADGDEAALVQLKGSEGLGSEARSEAVCPGDGCVEACKSIKCPGPGCQYSPATPGIPSVYYLDWVYGFECVNDVCKCPIRHAISGGIVAKIDPEPPCNCK